jgi:thermitase
VGQKPRASSPRFESLAFQIEPRRGVRPETTARAAVRRAFPGGGWTVSPLNLSSAEFEATPRRPGRISVPAAWDATYRLRLEPRVVYAEPLFEIPNEEQFGRAPRPGGAARSGGGGDDDPGTEGNYQWSLEKVNAPKAWQLFGGRSPGAGVVVGHPDTGYTPHPEIAGPRLRVAEGYDFEDERSDPRDPLREGSFQHPGHGTSTSSLIMSAKGLQPGSAGPAFVSGTAPGASLIPIRVTNSVVLWSMSGLTKAVHHAASRGAHVISISLGGAVPSIALHNAMRDAEEQGVIVLCAAGNQVGFVVFPAAFDEVIAVAASTMDDQPWTGSCRGPAVDITAPGSSVWRARTERRNGVEQYSVERSSGTSYAVATTAGIAALWLSYHGRAELISRYGRNRLASVFKLLLQQTCRRVAGWDTAQYGPGIVNAKALLEAALPSEAPARGLRGTRTRAVSADDTALETLVHQLAPAPRSGVIRAVAQLLRVDEDRLPDAMVDVGAELAMSVGTDSALRGQLREAATATRAGAPGTRMTARAAGRRLVVKGASRRMRRYVTAGPAPARRQVKRGRRRATR